MDSSLIAPRFLSLGIASPQRTVNLRTSGDSPLTAKGRVPRTKEVQGALGRTEIGVIYPDLPWLMRFNSHPIKQTYRPLEPFRSRGMPSRIASDEIVLPSP